MPSSSAAGAASALCAAAGRSDRAIVPTGASARGVEAVDRHRARPVPRGRWRSSRARGIARCGRSARTAVAAIRGAAQGRRSRRRRDARIRPRRHLVLGTSPAAWPARAPALHRSRPAAPASPAVSTRAGGRRTGQPRGGMHRRRPGPSPRAAIWRRSRSCAASSR